MQVQRQRRSMSASATVWRCAWTWHRVALHFLLRVWGWRRSHWLPTASAPYASLQGRCARGLPLADTLPCVLCHASATAAQRTQYGVCPAGEPLKAPCTPQHAPLHGIHADCGHCLHGRQHRRTCAVGRAVCSHLTAGARLVRPCVRGWRPPLLWPPAAAGLHAPHGRGRARHLWDRSRVCRVGAPELGAGPEVCRLLLCSSPSHPIQPGPRPHILIYVSGGCAWEWGAPPQALHHGIKWMTRGGKVAGGGGGGGGMCMGGQSRKIIALAPH